MTNSRRLMEEEDMKSSEVDFRAVYFSKSSKKKQIEFICVPGLHPRETETDSQFPIEGDSYYASHSG